MTRTACIFSLVLFALNANGQAVDRSIRKGNEAYRKGDATTAIANYERAKADRRGAFNLGNAYYRQDSVRDAQSAFEAASSLSKNPNEQARAFHNLGNTWLKQQKWQEAVNAYKQALKRAPDDEDTRYNLAYAQKKLAEEKQKKDDQKKDDQQQDQQQEPKPEEGQPKPDQQKQQPGQMDKQDAQRMLDAVQQQEKDTQDKAREKMRVRERKPIEKDW